MIYIIGSKREATSHADVSRLVSKRQLCPVQGSRYYYVGTINLLFSNQFSNNSLDNKVVPTLNKT